MSSSFSARLPTIRKFPEIRDRLERFVEDWAAVWAEFGPNFHGAPAYRRVLGECRAAIAPIAGERLLLKNELLLMNVLDLLIFAPALAPALASGHRHRVRPRPRLAS